MITIQSRLHVRCASVDDVDVHIDGSDGGTSDDTFSAGVGSVQLLVAALPSANS